MAELPIKPRRGRPPISKIPGVRSMVHLPAELDTELRAAGGGSLSLGIIRQAAGLPPLRTAKQGKALTRSRARAQKALDVVNRQIGKIHGCVK
jgi:hypothetical protein